MRESRIRKKPHILHSLISESDTNEHRILLHLIRKDFNWMHCLHKQMQSKQIEYELDLLLPVAVCH